MSRGDASALKKATAAAASKLPRIPLAAHAPLWRAQFEGRGPWWWSRRSHPGAGGRCDLAYPHGTVCFATTAASALIEKLWDPGRADPDDPSPQVIDSATLRRIILWQSSEAPSSILIANLTDGRGGLPKEFSAAPYAVTQGWANEIHASGAGGLSYWLRLDPDDGRGVALFETGPDDHAAGFEREAFPLGDAARGGDYAEKLPVQLFRVAGAPADEEITEGGLDDIPLA